MALLDSGKAGSIRSLLPLLNHRTPKGEFGMDYKDFNLV